MKLIKHKSIDGFEVFVGTERAAIEPEATKKACNALIAKIPEQVEFDAKIKEGKRNTIKAVKFKKNFMVVYDNVVRQIIAKNPKLNPARSMVLAAMTPDTKKKLINDEKLYNSYVALNIEVENALTEIGGRLRDKSKEIRRANPVYCEYDDHPEKDLVDDNETADELVLKHVGKSQREQVCIDGSVVNDFRGCCHHKKTSGKWSKKTIDKLGVVVPVGSILTENLTTEEQAEIHAQDETERIAGLFAEDKSSELDGMIKIALAQSVQMRGELEILADPDALTKAQGWYNDEVTRLEGVYS